MNNRVSAQAAYFRTGDRRFSSEGIAETMPAGPLASLDARSRAFFKAAPKRKRLLGATPFDIAADDFFYAPHAIAENPPSPNPAALWPRGRRWGVTPMPDAAGYADMVARALPRLSHNEGLRKVVLARALKIAAEAPLDARLVAERLGVDPQVVAFMVPLPQAGGRQRCLVGATPELLIRKEGRMVTSNPLAGSARRHSNPAKDAAIAAGLEASDKNRREHAAVVEAILDALSPYCETISLPRSAKAQSTASMWHLGTRIEARLRDPDISCAELLAAVHPTPAVCGWPRREAQDLISELEPFDRGFYAGAVGWLESSGDGEFYIALRCGELSGDTITLFAGAGIVPGSDPRAEAEETSAKFVALLAALGIDEHGRCLEEHVA